MKFDKAQSTHAAYLLALRRLLMSGLSQRCRIRKCHRDRACTGPLVDVDGETPWLESEDDARNGDPCRTIVPVCVLHLDDEDIRRFNAAFRKMADLHAKDREVSIRLKDKAVRANSKTAVGGITVRR